MPGRPCWGIVAAYSHFLFVKSIANLLCSIAALASILAEQPTVTLN